MSDNNSSISINIDPYFFFCVAFAIVGVWFPDYFMWVVWAFVAYVAVSAVVSIIAMIYIAVITYKATRWF